MALSVMKKQEENPKTISGSRKGIGEFKTLKYRTTVGGVTEPYQYSRTSIDTTGYSKGKPTYELKEEFGEGDKVSGHTIKGGSSKKVFRKDVPSILKSLKK